MLLWLALPFRHSLCKHCPPLLNVYIIWNLQWKLIWLELDIFHDFLKQNLIYFISNTSRAYITFVTFFLLQSRSWQLISVVFVILESSSIWVDITFNSRWWKRVWLGDRSYFCQKKFWAITTPRQIVLNHNCCKYFGPIMFREIFRANHISRTIPPFIRIRPAFAALPDYYFD